MSRLLTYIFDIYMQKKRNMEVDTVIEIGKKRKYSVDDELIEYYVGNAVEVYIKNNYIGALSFLVSDDFERLAQTQHVFAVIKQRFTTLLNEAENKMYNCEYETMSQILLVAWPHFFDEVVKNIIQL